MSLVGGYFVTVRFGEAGAAWISCGTLILVNALAAIAVRKRLGFRSAGL
jgi:hypothetical protein